MDGGENKREGERVTKKKGYGSGMSKMDCRKRSGMSGKKSSQRKKESGWR